MSTLLTIYWLCFGVGLTFVLLSGALGALSHGFAGHHGDGGPDLDGHEHDFSGDHGADVAHADHAAPAHLESADIDSAHAEAGFDGAHAGEHAGTVHGGGGVPEYSPFSLLSVMGTLAGFGAGGLLATFYGASPLIGLGGAFAGSAVMSILLWLIIGKLLFGLHSSSEAHVEDMIGLEAEVLTPVEHNMSGEIAYVLDGTRYTAPARLTHEGRVTKADKVRIRRVGETLVYVEEKRKLLS